MKCEQEALANAYLDGELDAAASAQLEAHLESCDSCRNVVANHRALKAAIREHADYFSAPEGLRAALKNQLGFRGLEESRSAAADDGGPLKPRAGLRSTRQAFLGRDDRKGWKLGSALAAALLVGWLLGSWSNHSGDRVTDDVVSSHVRSLMSTGHLIDVVSSDQHTVKPWFNGKLDFAPEVHELSALGFALIGGRLDYIDDHPAAALVYRHKAHTINLFIWPALRPSAPKRPLLTTRGYNISCWSAGGMENCAVSDMNRSDLARFVAGVRSLDPHAGT